MSYNLEYRDRALLELKEAYVWYEKRQAGLGKELRKEVKSKIGKITNNPYHYKGTHKTLREALVERFPYVIIYHVNEQSRSILILSIFHTSRNPKTKDSK